MKTEPIRVLHVFGRTDMGGAENRVMDLYRNMNHEKIQFDFMTHTNDTCYFDKEIESLGGHVYHVPRFLIYNWHSYKAAWKRFFAEHKEFKAVHGHMTSTAAIYLPIAKKSGVPLTIAHARSAGVDPGIKGKLTRILRKPLAKRTDKNLACSAEAAVSVFGRDAYQNGLVTIVPNAVKTSRFKYDETIRQDMRKNLGLSENIVVGHVGRLHYAKNHEFLFEAFQEFQVKHASAKLLIVGDGSRREELKKLVSEMKLTDSVIFAGAHENVQDYLQAMDMFVFPSHYEGFPGTVVEAQANGLSCLVSDSVTKECKASDLVSFLSLDAGAKAWAEQMEELIGKPREDVIQKLIDAGFDAAKQLDFFEELYLGE